MLRSLLIRLLRWLVGCLERNYQVFVSLKLSVESAVEHLLVSVSADGRTSPSPEFVLKFYSTDSEDQGVPNNKLLTLRIGTAESRFLGYVTRMMDPLGTWVDVATVHYPSEKLETEQFKFLRTLGQGSRVEVTWTQDGTGRISDFLVKPPNEGPTVD